MKILKKVVFTMAIAAMGSVFADAGNALISFESAGTDKYADGSVVLDGEWYALVWSSDGKFDGLKLDCTVVDPNDEVSLVAPLAKDGGCPLTVFQVDSAKVRSGGVYAVLMLDTRDAAKSAPAGKTAKGLPTFVNADVLSGQCAQGSAQGGATAVSKAGEWAESKIDSSVAGYQQVKITTFELDGSKAKITVEGMMPGVQYNVNMGKSLNKLDAYALATPKTASDNPTFVIERGDAQFFKVMRNPIGK